MQAVSYQFVKSLAQFNLNYLKTKIHLKLNSTVQAFFIFR